MGASAGETRALRPSAAASTAMTDYLKQFIERAADVPLQLRRRLALIRDLDDKATQLQREIDEQVKKQLVERTRQEQHPSKRQKVAAEHDAPPPQQQLDVDSALKRLVSLADEKVNIANQIYDFIDKHINHLDSDLQQLDAEIEADRKELGLQGDETACEKLGIELPKGLKASALGGGGGASQLVAEKKRRGRKKDEVPVVVQPALVVPTENEPAYCICNKPSAGNMVGCDHPDCTIEWFHFDCVGLKAEPVGEWYCPLCVAKMR